MKLTDFFANDYVNQASYDNLRKIASLVDGQKNASRKILYTILEKNIQSKIKVSQLGSKVAEFSEYLHGSLDNVIVNLAQDYAGTNNIPLLQKKGNFGTRFNPEASATRYIYTYGTPEFFELFNKSDTQILKHQTFEGQKIEPMFYVPSLPILLINGSEGVSSGFAQKILPRNPTELKTYIKQKLKGVSPKVKLFPWYKGFNGTIEKGLNPGQWYIKGICKKIGANKVQITEIPPGCSLKGYIKILDDLEDKKIIQSYRDKSEDDVFLFDVTVPSKMLKLWDDNELLIKLKLQKTVTENCTVTDENNKIRVYDNVHDILEHYMRVKLEYMELRKIHLVQKITQDIKIDYSKYLFIKLIQDNELIISKRKKPQIVKDLEKHDKIVKRDDSYDYLLNMSIIGLTTERMQKLENDIKFKHAELAKLTIASANELWNSEL